MFTPRLTRPDSPEWNTDDLRRSRLRKEFVLVLRLRRCTAWARRDLRRSALLSHAPGMSFGPSAPCRARRRSDSGPEGCVG